MKFIIIFLMTIFGPISLAQNISDTAIFKIEEQIFYLSDVNKFLRPLEVFRCIGEKSYLVRSIELSKKDYESISPFVGDYKVLTRRQEQLQKLLLLNKVLMYSASINVEVTESELDAIGLKKCNKSGELSTVLKLFIRSEFLLRDRFLRQRTPVALDAHLLEKIRIFYSGVNRRLSSQIYFL
ncbi:hypothetical protein BMS_1864 [Halobacteriovorax marinus SJ]|uniref:Secreted protein n=1 Tax=Halobacteriovorax marinus (strain ATCC BAA-682 / DSM 15412 / SJ) TaxID=862908 RepID=E1X224_HALMS|nr:hypothetical protein [Halobacteriovorax marinus]CBW26684.1 hypothetical protein BMS_1864 [Halobacteriovorax marinus SJ]